MSPEHNFKATDLEWLTKKIEPIEKLVVGVWEKNTYVKKRPFTEYACICITCAHS